jgi:hypothetical protein
MLPAVTEVVLPAHLGLHLRQHYPRVTFRGHEPRRVSSDRRVRGRVDRRVTTRSPTRLPTGSSGLAATLRATDLRLSAWTSLTFATLSGGAQNQAVWATSARRLARCGLRTDARTGRFTIRSRRCSGAVLFVIAERRSPNRSRRSSRSPSETAPKTKAPWASWLSSGVSCCGGRHRPLRCP